MRVSYQWLSEYLALPDADALQKRLAAAGFPVDAVEHRGKNLAGVVSAKILASDKHPNAEKLSVTRIDAGQGEPLQVVCGAKNYRVGDIVPLATVGALLPGGQKIEKAKLRGVESFGMLCSARELGLVTEADGLLILPANTPIGIPIARALELEDVVFEIDVTPNRPDALSHFGLARELSAHLGAALKPPATHVDEPGPPATDAIRVRIDDAARCPRYAARVVEGVRIGPSPQWLQRRLEACGVRPISNVVDITNFVLLELGHPLHAFDIDKVAGDEIIVRTARSGEKMTTLDGKERALSPEDLVIADSDRASALAGVMGGGDSEISAGTTRVLIESAYFEPVGVRRTAKRHGLHTEASHRFERGADYQAVGVALDRCARLIAELAGGTVRRGRVDVAPSVPKAPEIRMRWQRPEEILGLPVDRARVASILKSLGLSEREASAESALWQVPSWRIDLTREEDLVEEVARLIGFDAIPETLPALTATAGMASRGQSVVDRVRNALSASGFDEVVNLSFIAAEENAAVGERGIPLKNPISADMAVMRASPLPSLLRNAALNVRQRANAVRLYELGRIYAPHASATATDVSREPQHLAGIALGRRSPMGWDVEDDAVDFYDVKSAVEAILGALHIAPGDVSFVSAQDVKTLHPRSATEIRVAGKRVGTLGEVHPRIANTFELPRNVQVFDLDADTLFALGRAVPVYHPIPKLPAVLRDLAVVVDESIPVGRILDLVRESGRGLVEDVALFDLYRGAPLPAGKKNIAMALRYRAADRTLTDEEAGQMHDRIVERLKTTLGAELRS